MVSGHIGHLCIVVGVVGMMGTGQMALPTGCSDGLFRVYYAPGSSGIGGMVVAFVIGFWGGDGVSSDIPCPAWENPTWWW